MLRMRMLGTRGMAMSAVMQDVRHLGIWASGHLGIWASGHLGNPIRFKLCRNLGFDKLDLLEPQVDLTHAQVAYLARPEKLVPTSLGTLTRFSATKSFGRRVVRTPRSTGSGRKRRSDPFCSNEVSRHGIPDPSQSLACLALVIGSVFEDVTAQYLTKTLDKPWCGPDTGHTGASRPQILPRVPMRCAKIRSASEIPNTPRMLRAAGGRPS